MSNSRNKNVLSRRAFVAAKAIEALAPPDIKDPVRWEAVRVFVDDYDEHPDPIKAEAELLEELESQSCIRKRLEEASVIYEIRRGGLQKLDLLLKKMDQGFRAIEDRALKAEGAAKKQRPWILAGKILSGALAVFLGFCTFLGVPTKYTKPYLDKYVDPLLGKIGLYRIEALEKTEAGEKPAAPDPVVKETSPAPFKPAEPTTGGVSGGPRSEGGKSPAYPQVKPNKQSAFGLPNDGKLACFRSPQARKPPCRHHHI
jgi:hypothetical protein